MEEVCSLRVLFLFKSIIVLYNFIYVYSQDKLPLSGSATGILSV